MTARADLGYNKLVDDWNKLSQHYINQSGDGIATDTLP